jgi:hypothetical protein
MRGLPCFFNDFFGYQRCIRRGNLTWWRIIFIVNCQINNLWGLDYRRGILVVAYLDGFPSLGGWHWLTRYALDNVFVT